jgi:hypothetical protein
MLLCLGAICRLKSCTYVLCPCAVCAHARFFVQQRSFFFLATGMASAQVVYCNRMSGFSGPFTLLGQ